MCCGFTGRPTYGCPTVTLCFRGAVVTPLSVVDLPESYKDALAGVTGTFRASFQPFHRAWKLSGRFSNQQHLTGGLPGAQPVKKFVIKVTQNK
jgi:hypothetical protein